MNYETKEQQILYDLPDFPSDSLLVLGKIGQGSFGKVHKALDNNKKTILSLKFIELQNKDKTQIQEILTEKEIMMKISQIENPSFFLSFQGIYKQNFLSTEGKHNIVIAMEYGVASMSDVLKIRGKYSESEVIYILIYLLEGFTILESSHIVHGDIKPSNLILVHNENNNEFTYKIGDFGSSLLLENMAKSNQGLIDTKEIKTITRGYSSPETKCSFMMNQNSEKTQITYYDPFKSDVFSLGIVTLRMLGFAKKNIQKIVKSIECKQMQEYFQKKGFTRIFKIIKCMISQQVENRFSFADLFGIIRKYGLGVKPDETMSVEKLERKDHFPENLTDEKMLQICKNLIQVYYRLKNFDLCNDLVEKALNDVNSKKKYGFWIEWLATIIYRKGDLNKAIELYKEASKINKSLYGEKNYHLVSIKSNLAFIREKNGDLEKAVKTLNSLKSILTSLFGEKHNKTIKCLFRMSRIYEKLKDFKTSIEIYRELIRARKQIYGKDDETLGLYCNNMAFLLRENNKNDQAIEFHNKANKIFSVYHYEKFEILAKSYINTANTYNNLKNYKEAINFQKKALELYKNHYENHNIEVFSECYSSLSKLHQKLGQFDEALHCENQSFIIIKSLYGTENEKSIKKISNLAQINKELLNYKAALQFYEEVIEKLRKFDFPQETIASCMNNMGILYRLSGDLKKALLFGQDALEIYKTIFGENHLQTAISYNNVGLVLQETKEYKLAIGFYEKALKSFRIFSEYNQNILSSLSNLASTYRKSKNYPKAIEIYKECLKICQELDSNKGNKAQLCQIMSQLGAIYYEMGDFNEAREYQSQALDSKINIYGEYHEETLISVNMLASVEKRDDKLTKSLEFYERGLAISYKIFGKNHSLTNEISKKILDVKKKIRIKGVN